MKFDDIVEKLTEWLVKRREEKYVAPDGKTFEDEEEAKLYTSEWIKDILLGKE